MINIILKTKLFMCKLLHVSGLKLDFDQFKVIDIVLMYK